LHEESVIIRTVRAAAGVWAWNPGDPRVFTPKAFGWGLGVNWYWLVHPLRLIRARRSR
jgi:hypothetical protein